LVMHARYRLSAWALSCALGWPSVAHSQGHEDQKSQGQEVVPPALLEQPELYVEGEEAAYVELVLTVRTDGSASDAAVAAPSDAGLDARALEAVARLRFEPARRGGQPIDVRIRYRMLFK